MISMERHRKILEYTLSALLRRRYKNLALIAIFSLIVTVLSSILFLTHSFKAETLQLLDGTPSLIVQKMVAGRHDLIPVEYQRRIKNIPGVGQVRPRYWGYYYDPFSGGNYSIVGVDPAVTSLELMKGTLPEGHGECAVGRGVAEARLTGIGEKLLIVDGRGITRNYTITGEFTAPSNMITNDLVLLKNEEVVRLFGLPAGRATDLVVEVYNDAEVPNVASKIKQLLPDTRPIMRSEIVRTYDTVFSWRSGMVLTMFLGAILAFGILAWDKATGLSADEKQEIGILKAIGWETADVLEMKFWEGIVISLTSFLMGVIFGYVHVYVLGASFLAPALKGWSVLFPPFRLMPQIDLYQVFVLLFLTVVPYVASTVVPSWKTAITDPDVVMRG